MTRLSSLVTWLTMLGEWGIVFAILYEGWIALKEYRSSKIFETIKFLEEWETRKQRRLVYERLYPLRPSLDAWWEHDKELANAAADVCARYGLVGAVTKSDRAVREFVAREWADNICRSYEALKDYIRYRETATPGAFRQYTSLYEEAAMHRSTKRHTSA